MDYSIEPETHELEKARDRISEALNSYSYAFSVESAEFYLNWQKLEGEKTSYICDDREIILVIDPDKDWKDEIQQSVLRGLSQIEFDELSDFEEIRFNWQEVLRFAYVKMKMSEMVGEEPVEKEELGDRWNELRENLSEEISDQRVEDFFYMNAGVLGGMIGQKLRESYELEKFPDLKRSDVIQAGDELFS